jgi:DNA-binding response OmpR family regulator
MNGSEEATMLRVSYKATQLDGREILATGPGSKATILIVDANVEFAERLRSFLEQRQYQAVAVHTGREALAYLSENGQVNAMVLDVLMPGRDGWETCRQLRQSTSVPILILTGRSHASDIVHGFALGVDEYLVKPLHLDEIAARLEGHLQRARLSNGASPYRASTAAHDDVLP